LLPAPDLGLSFPHHTAHLFQQLEHQLQTVAVCFFSDLDLQVHFWEDEGTMQLFSAGLCKCSSKDSSCTHVLQLVLR
jgi:hypothetical protein